MEAGLVDIDPKDEDLQSQLGSIRYEELPNGRIKVESKKELKARGLPSPDRADTLMMVTAPTGGFVRAYTDPTTGAYNRPSRGTLTSDLLDKPMM